MYNPAMKKTTEEKHVSRYAIVELATDELKFSAGHFMLLSATEREGMHGHDYAVRAALHTRYHSNGMGFDCRIYKQKLKSLCQLLDYRFLLPMTSEYLRVEETATEWRCQHNHQTFAFLKKDAIGLNICNVTLEELSHWFLTRLTEDREALQEHGIEQIRLTVSNGRGDAGTALWHKDPAGQIHHTDHSAQYENL